MGLTVNKETPLVPNSVFVTVILCLLQSVIHAGSEIPCVVLGLSCRWGELDIIMSCFTEWVVRMVGGLYEKTAELLDAGVF